MEKKLKNYIKEATELAEHPTDEARKYHEAMLQQFQHERLIHLIVTLFFALFTILFFAVYVILAINAPRGAWGQILTNGSGVISAILVVVLTFYIRHYYLLENGVQKLEEMTKRFYKK